MVQEYVIILLSKICVLVYFGFNKSFLKNLKIKKCTSNLFLNLFICKYQPSSTVGTRSLPVNGCQGAPKWPTGMETLGYWTLRSTFAK